MKSTVNSTLSRQNQKPHEKYLVLKKEEEIKHFYLACGNYREKQEHFNFRIPLFVKFVKQHPLRKVKVIKKGRKGRKAWKGNPKDAGLPLLYPASID